MGIEDELLKIKNKITSEEKKQAEVEIKLNLKLETLKNDFDCKDLEEAETYKKELETSKKSLQKEIQNAIMKLKEELEIE